MKIRPVGTELLNEDGRTDMTMITVYFRNCAKAPPPPSPNKREAQNRLLLSILWSDSSRYEPGNVVK